MIGYLLYNKFKKPEQSLIHVPPPADVSHASTKIEPKRYSFEMYLKISITSHIYIHMVVENYMKDLKERIYHGAGGEEGTSI